MGIVRQSALLIVVAFVTGCSKAPRSPQSTASITPESFGAVGDDSADDAVTLQRAVDVAAKRGVGVHLAADRTYVLNRALDLPSGKRITSEGASSVLRFTRHVAGRQPDLGFSRPGRGLVRLPILRPTGQLVTVRLLPRGSAVGR